MRLNDKQTLLTIKALSHYINNSLQYVANDDIEKTNAKYLLQAMEGNLLNENVEEHKMTLNEAYHNYCDNIAREDEAEKRRFAAAKLIQNYNPISLWKLVPLSIETRVIFSTFTEREDIIQIKFGEAVVEGTCDRIVFMSLTPIEDSMCSKHDIDDLIKIIRSGNNLQIEQRTPNGHVWHEFELLDHQLYSLLESDVFYDIALN